MLATAKTRLVSSSQGFSLLELMVAMVVTLVITGAMYGLIASGQGAFRREPALIDRQQQIRIGISRIEEDLITAGLGLGAYFQTFAPGDNAVGVAGAAGAAITGVRPAGDPLLGGGLPDALEMRVQDPDCAQVRATRIGNSVNFLLDPGDLPPAACYAPPSLALAFYPSGAAKFALIFTIPSNDRFNFAIGQNTAAGTQFTSTALIGCDVDVNPCPAPNQADPTRFAKASQISYRLGLETDPTTGLRTPALYRSATGGLDAAAGTFNTLPPGPAWQLVALGIEDLQIRYRVSDAAGNPVWLDNAPLIAPPSLDNVVREVEVTLWARTLGENNLPGQSVAAGNGVTAVRGSLVTSVSPRGAQDALTQEVNPAKRWQ